VSMTTPSNLDATEQATIAAAERIGVPFEMIPCDPADADTAAFCARYGYPAERAANTIVVASKKEPKQYGACVVLATTRLDVNHAVRDLLGVNKVSFATAEEMNALTGMTVGGVTVFGLPDGLPLYVDARVMDLDWIILGTGGRNGKVRISPQVFHRMAGVKVVEGLAIPQRSA
jgi:prolyl-tRNA editing enzyme YbaK/EbsC (Cys-tRNA(Pro) deacylase)